MDYKFNKKAGVLNEAAPVAPRRKEPAQQQQQQVQAVLNDMPIDEMTGRMLQAPLHAQGRAALAPVPKPASSGRDPITSGVGRAGMWSYTVLEGERVRVIEKDGRVRVVVGPSRIFTWGRRVEPMSHYVAHPGEFLIVRYRDGRQEHLLGPADLWFDPREHASVEREDALQIASKEAVVVYSKSGERGEVARRVVYGPTAFVPKAGEWLHTFSWHGSRSDGGYQKVPNALVFQKLWFLPDQMYHDVADVRTADDAVLTIRLMIFFELTDVETMLDTTHDPIGDFVNAASSDVVEMVSKHDFESFKRATERLNDLDSYKQLTARAAQCGYRINKVVYRGYGAPEALQRMHDEAIESRTRLMLERATQEQAQDLEDVKQGREQARASRQRGELQAQLEHDIAQARRRQEAELREATARDEHDRTRHRASEELQLSLEKAREAAQREHLAGLRALGVDLTSLLTKGRADQVIELRNAGPLSPHVHLDAKRDREP